MKPNFKAKDIITKIYIDISYLKLYRSSMITYIVTEAPDGGGIWKAIRPDEAIDWLYDMSFFDGKSTNIISYGEDFHDA